jgi:hypothetical protein
MKNGDDKLAPKGMTLALKSLRLFMNSKKLLDQKTDQELANLKGLIRKTIELKERYHERHASE